MDLLGERGHKVVPLALANENNADNQYAGYFLPSPFGDKCSHFGNAHLSFIDKVKLVFRSMFYGEAYSRVKHIVKAEKIDVVYILNICNYISPSVILAAKHAGARAVMRLSDFNYICPSYNFYRNGDVCTECKTDIRSSLRNRCVRNSFLLTCTRVLSMKFHDISGIYKKLDAFISPSKFMARTLVEKGFDETKVHWVPSFVNLAEFIPCFDPGDYVLYHGRLSPEKGLNILIETWKILGTNAPKLLIAGSGEDEQKLRNMATNVLPGKIEFLGQKNKNDIIALIQKSAFVLIPSLCHDNAPMSAYESMACGKPIIASRLGGLIDQIGEDDAGILVAHRDPVSLAQAVEQLWSDKNRISKLGQVARRRMETLFSPEQHLSAIERIFSNKQV
jgi:glycosyltransferase involved in cell wall biosynthesis